MNFTLDFRAFNILAKLNCIDISLYVRVFYPGDTHPLSSLLTFLLLLDYLFVHTELHLKTTPEYPVEIPSLSLPHVDSTQYLYLMLRTFRRDLARNTIHV
jgi:hypothetical protein